MIDRELLDIVWMVLCAILVLLMQAGFACLEGGLVRAKNSINVVIKNLMDFCVAGLSFWLIGFGLAFGTSAYGVFGTTSFLSDSSLPGHSESWTAAFFFFQLVFCGTATTIVSGAVAERMRFAGYLACATVLSTLIYPIVAHWAWGRYSDGEQIGWLAAMGFVDFAGSTVVHSVGGWMALAAVLVIGPRVGRFGPNGRRIEGHNLPLAMLGMFLMWVGWFGFNAGSTLAVNADIARIVVNTVLSPIAGGLAAIAVSWIGDSKKPNVEGGLNGVLAGLVGITAACNVVGPAGAILIGAVSGVILILGDWLLTKLEIDDAVNAVPVHLFAGIWGTLAVALVGDPDLWGTGLSRLDQLFVQAIGVGSIGVYAFCVAWILVKAIDKMFPLRASADDETIGLNIAEHDANSALLDLVIAMDRQRAEGDFSKSVTVDPTTEAGQIAHFYNGVIERVRQETAHRESAVKRMETAKDQAEEANRTKTQFLANMSHELRTPLNAVIGFSELLNQQVYGPLGDRRYKEYAEDIEESGRHLLRLINDLLDLSKIEARRYELFETQISPRDLVESVIRLMRPTADDKGLDIGVAIDDRTPAAILADERAFRQILINLLSNAIKFTPQGGRIDVEAMLEADGRLAITVTDTGIGIPREKLAEVLEPFSRGDSAIAQSTPGTGLGLSITRSLVRLHGGTLVLRSNVNVGTSATVRFPTTRIDGKPQPADDLDENAPSSTQQIRV